MFQIYYIIDMYIEESAKIGTYRDYHFQVAFFFLADLISINNKCYQQKAAVTEILPVSWILKNAL